MSEPEPKHVAGADSATVNFFTVNAKGEVTATFEGVIVATGFSLTENEKVESAPTNSIVWKSVDGVGREFVFGTGVVGGTHELRLIAHGTQQDADIILVGTDEVGGTQSQVLVFAGASGRTLLRNDGTSDFLQVAQVVTQQDIELFGSEPVAAKALHIDLSFKEYLPPGDAFSASVRALEGTNSGTILRAYWDVAWNPRGKKGNSIQLYTFEGEAFGVKEPLATTPESESETPVHPTALITNELKKRWEKAKANNSYITLGYRVKTDAAATLEPIMFSNYVVIQWVN